MNLRKAVHKFKAFAVAETVEDFVIEKNGATLVREVKYHRIPNLLEAQMERVNKVWRFYSKKFVQNPAIAAATTKMNSTGDINISGNLKVLLDMKEQMEDYKKNRDLDGMVMTMRTMYSMLRLLGYKRDPHDLDEYKDMDMSQQATLMLEKYKLLPPKGPSQTAGG